MVARDAGPLSLRPLAWRLSEMRSLRWTAPQSNEQIISLLFNPSSLEQTRQRRCPALHPDLLSFAFFGYKSRKTTKETRIFSALGKWGRTHMGSDGFNRISTGFYLFSPVGVRLVPSKTHVFKGFRPDFNRILTRFHGVRLKSG